MTRYNLDKNVKTRYDGRRFLGTRLYPVIAPDASDLIYISNETDHLDTLADRFYKDITLWWIIALVNNLGNGRLSVPIGTQLRIPVRIDAIMVEYNKLNV